MTKKHRAIFITNQSNKQGFIMRLLNDSPPEGFKDLEGQQGALFSKLALDNFIEEEVRHDKKILTQNTSQSLQSMSSGERKKALLNYLLQSKLDFLILDNPFDNLDTDTQEALITTLTGMATNVLLIQLVSRKKDLLPFVTNYFELKGDVITAQMDGSESKRAAAPELSFQRPLPHALAHFKYEEEYLVQMNNVSVSYGAVAILNNINWDIRRGEFWQLKGKNGSGKTTLLSMVTGDNPKGYGQQLYLFGSLKGSGESIWDIKNKIGYFTPAMIDRFKGYHTLEHMLISGLMDSIGLYILPTEIQLRLAAEWLELIQMYELRSTYFHDLSMGQQRLIMCVRAMIKHPLLLILDEPTAGLDDKSAAFFVSLVNKIAQESRTAIIFVSHRQEPGLRANLIYELIAGEKGSIGEQVHN